ncbi:uncharacterized protein [Dipodomys merriami]|uniref:uncharacterized protein isoform X2 n=1 Tax=Dipodomys merriami TaxID=94247 RepID=UPI003855855C
MCSQVCKECTDLLQLLSLQALVFWMSVTKPIPISIMGMWFDASSTLWQSMRVNLLMELRAHERIYVPLSHFVLGLELWVWALFLSSSAQGAVPGTGNFLWTCPPATTCLGPRLAQPQERHATCVSLIASCVLCPGSSSVIMASQFSSPLKLNWLVGIVFVLFFKIFGTFLCKNAVQRGYS